MKLTCRLKEKFKYWWKSQAIQEQIFLSMLLLIIFGVGILGNVAYKASVNAIEQNYRDSHEISLKNSSKVLDLTLSNIIEIGRSYLNDEKVKEVLQNSDYTGYRFLMNDNAVLNARAETMLNQQPKVGNIIFMDLYGHYFQMNRNKEVGYQFYQYYKNNDIYETTWCKKAREQKGKEVFFSDYIVGSSEKQFCYVKYLINPSNSVPMGYLIVGISDKVLANSFVVGTKRYSSSSYMVLDNSSGKQEIIYYDGEEEQKENIQKELNEDEKQSSYIFSEVLNAKTGWMIVNAVEKNELSGESKKIRSIVFGGGGIILFFCFFFAKMISKSIMRPLKQLEQIISRVGEGERHIEEEFDHSEVGKIGGKFKEMVNTNLELREHLMEVRLNEREAEVLLLQSQINPHFLYNTLDSIYCVAIMHGDDQIADMTMALSANFKLALNHGDRYISIEDSMKWIQEYMKLQNMRYNNRFELSLDVEPELMKKKTISFIFQPFVENAMYHGLEPKIGKGKILLTGKQQENEMIFTIEDDGVGVADPAKLDKGYGIRNVRERIRLNYGENYGVEVKSVRGEGTKITIRIPPEAE